MLSKLIKYELRATARHFLPIYLLLLIVSALNSVFISVNFMGGTVGASLVLVALGIALAVVTMILVIGQFYKSLMGDEGYLMNTLPVSVDSLILSKLITVFIWSTASTLVAAAAGFLLLLNRYTNQEFFTMLPRLFGEFVLFGASMDVGAWFRLIMIFIAGLVSFFVSLLQCYFSLAITQLTPFHRYRIPSAVICYVGISAIRSILSSLQLFGHSKLTSPMVLTLPSSPIQFLQNIGWPFFFSLLGITLLGLAFYFGTRYILKNKLNLE